MLVGASDAELDAFDLPKEALELDDFFFSLFIERCFLLRGAVLSSSFLLAFGGVLFFEEAMPFRAFAMTPISSLSRAMIEGRLVMVRRACCFSSMSPTTSMG